MKQRRTGLWRTLTVVFVLLTAFTVAGSGVAGTYSALINSTLGIETSRIVKANGAEKEDTQYFKSAYNSLEEQYQAKAALIRQIGREGTILLKNENNALPMQNGTVLVLGGGSFMQALAHGGGSMNAADLANATTVEQALTFDGLNVITEGAQADAALVVIGRSAGEGADMPEGGLALTAEELSLIAQAKAAAGKVMVLLSGDFYPEMASLQADPEISAILHLGNAGYRGAYGLADVITGKASPSGRTVETVAVDSHASAAMQNYGDHSYTNASKIMASQAKTYVVYAESIYKDYKYYETRYEDSVLNQGNASFGGWTWEQDVLYPFGYGLSYTTFTQELQGVTFDDTAHTAAVQVKVTNTGAVTGKEVVQVYGQSPYTEYDKEHLIEKAAVQLMGFEKTAELAPGASETVTVQVPMQWLASFDTKGYGTYIMEAGNYYFAVGSSAHDAVNNILAAKGANVNGSAALTYTWNQAETDASTYAKSLYTGESITASFPDADINYWLEEADRITYLSRQDWQGTWPETIQLTAGDKLKAALNDKKKYENGKYNDTASRIQVYDVKTGDGSTILSAAMMRGRPYNDEYWNTLLDNLTVEDIVALVANGRYRISAAPSVSFLEIIGGDSPTGLNIPYLYSKVGADRQPIGSSYMVSDGITEEKVDLVPMDASFYCSEPTLASTFNKALALAEGEMMGEDSLYCGASFLYGPGTNLHRTPYGGRATEYYSADPVLNSLIGAEQVKGGWSKGLVMVVKHFSANDQEQNRIGVATFVTEQDLRENMLRGFEGLMTYGGAMGLMGSYNRLGVLGTAAEYDLMTTVLRKEWGSDCFVITDLNSPTAGLYDGNAIIAAGTSTMMNNGTFDAESGSYVNTTLSAEAFRNDPTLRVAMREAAHHVLYAFVNSSAMNGQSANDRIETVTPWWQPALLALEIVFGAAALLTAALYLINVNKKEEGSHA